jgi:hypothetical protein
VHAKVHRCRVGLYLGFQMARCAYDPGQPRNPLDTGNAAWVTFFTSILRALYDTWLFTIVRQLTTLCTNHSAMAAAARPSTVASNANKEHVACTPPYCESLSGQ